MRPSPKWPEILRLPGFGMKKGGVGSGERQQTAARVPPNHSPQDWAGDGCANGLIAALVLAPPKNQLRQPSASSSQPHPSIALASGKVLPTVRSEEHTSELQSRSDIVCRLL